MLVDTDVLSFSIKGDARAARYARDLQGKRACLALMTVAELKRWPLEKAWGQRRTAALDGVLSAHVILAPDLRTAGIWAEVFAARRRTGRPIANGDCWIAATALQHGLPPVTHNAADYSGIPALRVITHAAT